MLYTFTRLQEQATSAMDFHFMKCSTLKGTRLILNEIFQQDTLTMDETSLVNYHIAGKCRDVYSLRFSLFGQICKIFHVLKCSSLKGTKLNLNKIYLQNLCVFNGITKFSSMKFSPNSTHRWCQPGC